jgi:hypothetical protein
VVVVAACALFAGFTLLYAGVKGHATINGQTVAIWDSPWLLIALWFSGKAPK